MGLMKEWKGLSLTGRLCYLFMCIEKYLVSCYPNKDWTPLAKRCWQWTDRYWDEGWDLYSQVVPEFLLEFDNYEETNRRAYEGDLPEKDYLELKQLFQDITDGSSEDEINRVLRLPIDFYDECAYTNFESADEPTLMILRNMQEVLALHNIAAPEIEAVKDMSAEIKGGWGDFVNSEYLSIIINPSAYHDTEACTK